STFPPAITSKTNAATQIPRFTESFLISLQTGRSSRNPPPQFPIQNFCAQSLSPRPRTSPAALESLLAPMVSRQAHPSPLPQSPSGSSPSQQNKFPLYNL